MSKLAKTTYEAGPDDELIVKDVYKDTSSAVYNSFQETDTDVYNLIDKIPRLNIGNLLIKINAAYKNARASLSLSVAGAAAGLSGLDKLGGFGAALGASGFGGLAGLSSGSFGSLGASGVLGKLGNVGVLGALGSLGNLGSVGELKTIVATAQASMGGISSLVSGVNLTVSTTSGLQASIMGQLNVAMGGDTGAFLSIAANVIQQNSVVKTSTNSLNNYSDFDTRVGYVGLDNLSKQLSSGNLDVFSSINDLPSSVTSSLNGGMSDSQITGNVVAQVGNTLTQLHSSVSSEAAEPIANIVNALSNNQYDVKITNRGASAALISAVSHIGNQLNMPNVFAAIASNVEDKSVLLEAAKPLVQRALEQGDIKTIESIASTKIASSITSIAPAVIPTILTTMQKPEGLAQQDYAKYYQAVKESFEAMDSSWTTYNRSGTDCVNAASLKDNWFVFDLIRSKLNELMSSNTYVANIQSVYGDNLDSGSSVTEALSTLLSSTSADTTSTAVDLSNVVVSDFDYTTEGDGVNTPKDTMTVTESTTTKTFDFSNEPFMLIASMYSEDSVDTCLKRDFPEWYSSLDVTPIAACDIK